MRFYLSVIMTLCGWSVSGQGENNIWTFGKQAGLDFNGTPVTSFQSAIGTGNMEACATVSNVAGQLLFYTDGSRVWNRTHSLMPGGNTLHGRTGSITESSQHGAQITPVIGEPGKYYIFSLTEWEAHASSYGGRLFYSVVDMSLNGGLGDVDPARKWIALDFNLTEKMIAVPGDDCNIWLLVHDLDTNMFKAYEITAGGVNHSPVRSYTGIMGSMPGPAGNTNTIRNRLWNVGQLNISPDRTKLAAAYLAPAFVELYNFDPLTGQVSGAFVLDTMLQLTGGNSYSGVAFSGDNSKLYTAGERNPNNSANSRHIHQYNMLAPGGAAGIRGSKILVGDCGINSHLRRATDNKIYFLHNNGTDSIGVIAAPDLPAPACQYRSRELTLQAGTYSQFTLGNDYVMPPPQDTMHQRHPEVLLCEGATMVLSGRPGFSGYLWEDGSTDSLRNISTPGTYYVLNIDACHSWVDTFVIRYRPVDSVFHHIDTFICQGAVLELSGRPGFTGYLWEDGSTDSLRVINTVGTYYVLNTDTCNLWVDTFVVSLRHPDSAFRRIDTNICASGMLELYVAADSAYWDNGSVDSVRSVSGPGVYHAGYLMPQGCTFYVDTFYVDEIDLSFDLGNDTVICGINPYVLEPSIPVAGVAYQWQDGSSGASVTVAVSGNYHLEITGSGCSAADSINIRFIDLRPDLGNDTVICTSELGGYQLQADIPEHVVAVWPDGSQGTTYTVNAAGIYWLSFLQSGCVFSDTVEVAAEICTCAASVFPSAFTPNGDGRNDVFRLVYEPGCVVSEFSLRVYDRWGRTVYVTNDPASGWDGQDAGMPANAGVYMYMSSFTAGSRGERRELKGDVALVR